jgi:hypothetical protein
VLWVCSSRCTTHRLLATTSKWRSS